MKVRLVVIGKTSQRFIAEGLEEYFKRLNKFVKLEYIELPDIKKTKSLSEDLVKQKEATIIEKYLTCDLNILLDEEGSEYTSVEFAKYIEDKINLGVKCIGFFIGGAYGFSNELRKKYDKIALSKMTFSHQLVRLVFVEQLYRAFTIIKFLPYHH